MSDVAGRPMLAWSLDAFEACAAIRDIVVVVGRHTADEVRDLIASGPWTRITSIVEGGTVRSESVRCGIGMLSEAIDNAVIHDAARPLVTQHDIQRCLAGMDEFGACILATRVTDTLKRVDTNMMIAQTIDRANIWAAQTPQAFRRDALLNVFEQSRGDQVTDEAMLYEALGHPVRIVEGRRENMKVTVPDDLALVDFLMRKRLGTL